MTEWNAKTAEWYANKYGEYPTNQIAVGALEFEATSVIVDIGYGTGSALRHAARRVMEGRLIGVDPVPKMIELARERMGDTFLQNHIQFRLGSAEGLPVDDAVADYVLAFESFDHWQDKKKGLEEARRVLKSGGSFVVVKDGGVPGGKSARNEFVNSAVRAGFVLVNEERIRPEGIDFALWVFSQ